MNVMNRGMRNVTDEPEGTAADRVIPEIPVIEIFGIEILEEMLRVEDIPVSRHPVKLEAGRFDVSDGACVIIEDFDRTHGDSGIEHDIGMFPEIYRELDVLGCHGHAVSFVPASLNVHSLAPSIIPWLLTGSLHVPPSMLRSLSLLCLTTQQAYLYPTLDIAPEVPESSR
jgi:hypothetical protein